jgi:hypothetical protein
MGFERFNKGNFAGNPVRPILPSIIYMARVGGGRAGEGASDGKIAGLSKK